MEADKIEVSRDFVETIVNFTNTASKDKTRRFLNGVHILKEDGKVILESTDGYTLARKSFDIPELFDVLPDSLILDAEYIKRLKPLLKSFKHIIKLFVSFSEEIFAVSPSLTSHAEDINIRTIQREYPKTTNIIPKESENNIKIAINPKFLMNLAKSFALDKNQGLILEINPDNLIRPVKVTSSDDDLIGVIMPITL